jgi:hypothetical protein
MKNSTLIGILLISIIASGAVYSVWAQNEVLLGVKEGDNFTYSFVVTWSSTDPNAIVPQQFADMNRTLSIHMNVTSTGGTMANLNITTTLRDGTQTTEPGYVEVARGGYVGAPLFLIGANLTAGNQVYPFSEPAAVAAGHSAMPFTINETITRTYLGASKTVNHYTESSTNATTNDTEQKDAYYDQATGVLMEMKLQFTSSSSGETDSEQWKITQFNNAVVPSDGTNNDGTGGTTDTLPSWLIPVVIVVVAVVVIVLIVAVMLRRRGKPKAQTSETAQTQPSNPSTYDI